MGFIDRSTLRRLRARLKTFVRAALKRVRDDNL